MYFELEVAEDKLFYENAFITLADTTEEINLDLGVDHKVYAPLLNEFDMIDLGNAEDVAKKELGNKEGYNASDISKLQNILQETQTNKKYVKIK